MFFTDLFKKFSAANRTFLIAMGAVPLIVSGSLALRAGTISSGQLQRQSSLEFKIPPTRIPLNIKDQPIMIVASGTIAMVGSSHEMTTFRVNLNADLADLQRNVTALLSSQLDKADRCGEQIEIQHATLMPVPPASVAVVQLHYARAACVKVFGKEKAKTLVAGNAEIQLKLTPVIGENHTELSLVPEVGPIHADGSLGELLRSGSLGEILREKIRTSVRSAIEKGTDLRTVIPAVAQNYVTLQNARFDDGGSGRLTVALLGEVRISKEQIQELSRELNDRRRNVSHPAD